MSVVCIRGAITAQENTKEEILKKTEILLNEINKENNIKDEETLLYLKSRTHDLFSVVIDELEAALNYKEAEIMKLEKRQNEANKKMDEMSTILRNISNDIYEDEDDFEIVCPYCNYEFTTDMADEERDEIKCPKCNKIMKCKGSGGIKKKYIKVL